MNNLLQEIMNLPTEMPMNREEELQAEYKALNDNRPLSLADSDKLKALVAEYNDFFGLKSYTVCYHDVDGTIKQAWHHITKSNIDYVKEKYKKQGKDIAYIVPRD